MYGRASERGAGTQRVPRVTLWRGSHCAECLAASHSARSSAISSLKDWIVAPPAHRSRMTSYRLFMYDGLRPPGSGNPSSPALEM